jgi:hypothetical protein
MFSRDQNKNVATKEEANQKDYDALNVSTISDYLNIEKSVAKIQGSFKTLMNQKRPYTDNRLIKIDSMVPNPQQSKLFSIQGSQAPNQDYPAPDQKTYNQFRARKSNAVNVMTVT